VNLNPADSIEYHEDGGHTIRHQDGSTTYSCPEVDCTCCVHPGESRPCDSTDHYDDSMDGDHASALASAGWGTDEDYGFAEEIF